MAARKERIGSLRRWLCLLLGVGMLLLAALAPAPAGAASLQGGGAFSELSEKAQEEEQPTSTSETSETTSTKEAGNSDKTIFLGVGAAAVLLLGIAFVIVRDARRVAPAGATEEFSDGRRGMDPVARRRNRRAKAKAARKQRKRNR